MIPTLFKWFTRRHFARLGFPAAAQKTLAFRLELLNRLKRQLEEEVLNGNPVAAPLLGPAPTGKEVLNVPRIDCGRGLVR